MKNKLYLILTLLLFTKTLFSAGIEDLNRPLVEITEKVMPAIVHLRVKRVIQQHVQLKQKLPGPFEDFFKGPMNQPPMLTEMVGSGVIVSKDGYIITNNHVISDAVEIKVILHNNKEYKAKIIGTDPLTDLAVIQFIEKDIPFEVAQLGNSKKLQVGEIVLALGSPFGLRKSVTQGIVSAKGRKNALGYGVNFIQTDAAINPGNSGGALVNLKGEVIGINSMILARSANAQTAGFQGIGLAIPINHAKKIMKQIIKNGRVIRGFLGIQPANLDENASKLLKIEKGVLINNVIEKSPAKAGGLKPWDLIVKVDNKETPDFDTLRNIIADTKVGSEISIDYIRGEKANTAKVTIKDFDDFNKKQTKKKSTYKKEKIDLKDPSLGIEIKPLSPQDRKILSKSYKVDFGLIVLKVKKNSVAARAGITPGDILLEIEGIQLNTPPAFFRAVEQHRDKGFFRIRINKRGSFFILPVSLKE